MGYSDRRNDALFTALWAAHGWAKLRYLWLMLRHPGAIRRLRAPLWRWLLNKPTEAVGEERLRVLARSVGSMADLDALLERVPDPLVRAAIRKRLKPMVRRGETQ